MEGIDILLKRIDKELGKHEDKIDELKLEGAGPGDVALLIRNIEYLKSFRKMALQVKEEINE